VERDCSREASVGETPVFLISATDRAGREGSLDLGVGVERSLAMAGPALPEGGVDVGRGVLSMPFPFAAVGLEWAGAKMACGSVQLEQWVATVKEKIERIEQTLGLYGSSAASQ